MQAAAQHAQERACGGLQRPLSCSPLLLLLWVLVLLAAVLLPGRLLLLLLDRHAAPACASIHAPLLRWRQVPQLLWRLAQHAVCLLVRQAAEQQAAHAALVPAACLPHHGHARGHAGCDGARQQARERPVARRAARTGAGATEGLQAQQDDLRCGAGRSACEGASTGAALGPVGSVALLTDKRPRPA
jgi:hypothetical protein